MPWLWNKTLVVFCVFCVVHLNGAESDSKEPSLDPGAGLNGDGRALNITSLNKTKSLDDLSLDDVPTNTTMCQGKYAVGEMFSPNCQERCRCLSGGKVLCEDRCQLPYVRKGLRADPLCEEKPSQDECCVVLTCSHESPLTDNKLNETCSHRNESFKVGETWNDGCQSVCTCNAGGISDCRPRCPTNATSSNSTATKEGCVSIPDRNDPCCMVLFCDVTLSDHEDSKLGTPDMMSMEDLRVKSADALNASAVIITFEGEPLLDANLTAEISEDGVNWKTVPMDGAIVHGLPSVKGKLRVVSGGQRSNAIEFNLAGLEMSAAESRSASSPPDAADSMENVTQPDTLDYCSFKGHNYTLGQEFNDDCVSFCICTDTGVDCSPIECPSQFGLDVLDPTCLKWETRPRDFNPKPPNCCSDKVRCLDNGSCNYKGQNFPNWYEIPTNLTGCERCFCELGNVTCESLCPPVPAHPPIDLPCPANTALLQHPPGDSCCKFWVCPAATHHEVSNKTKQEATVSSKPPHNYLAPFGLNEDGKPTEPPLPGPVRLPPQVIPSNLPPTTDAAHIPGPPYGPHHLPFDFLSTKDEGIHGPPPFVVKPNKHDLNNNYQGPKKPGHVVVANDNDDLDSLVGPFPLHPPLVGDVYVSQPQHKPILPAQHPHHIYHYLTELDHGHRHLNASGAELTGGAEGVTVQALEALDEHTVRLAFSVPEILVGLMGRVEVRYTHSKHNEDPSTWERQVLAPPGDLIATPQLHFDLGNLLPNATYHIFIKVILRDVSNAVQSPILSVTTPPKDELASLPPQITVEPDLTATHVNASWITLQWRKFTDFELQFIDGLQLRFRETGGKVFSATPLIHRSVTQYTLPDLKPNTSYEAGLFFIPFPGQTTELQAEKNINFVTALENDPYKFEIQLDIVAVKPTGVEVTWTGVPYPEDKYVNIYRVIYQSETGKEDFNSFKVAKRDSTPKITVFDLKPTTRYRLWLEAYLTNGRTKKSNVQDFVTKPGVLTAGSSHTGKLSSGSTGVAEGTGDYYGSLVAVAVLAALAIMAALILLLVLMRKHSENKAAITSRNSHASYDPSYKVEIQQETMDL